MLTLPPKIITILAPFASLFSPEVFARASLLVLGAILTPGKRTVGAALRALGLEDDPHFQNYHRVLNRAVWSPRLAARILLRLLAQRFVPEGPLVLGLDATLERRRGKNIQAKGIYHDPVRSSRTQFVKSSGLRWLSLMLLTPIPWAKRVWAFPFLTCLCPSERAWNEQHPQRTQSKKLNDWAPQMLYQVRRWFPQRQVVVVADSAFAVLKLLYAWQKPAVEPKPKAKDKEKKKDKDKDKALRNQPIIAVTRFRLDAALYEPASPRKKGQKGRSRVKGARLPSLQERLEDSTTPWEQIQVSQWYGRTKAKDTKAKAGGPRVLEVATGTALWYHGGMPPVPLRWVLVRDPEGELEPLALLCTDDSCTPEEIVSWYARRWCVEVTFEEARAHLGVETQRQWNDLAIARTTPCLLGLFSLVTLLAHQHWQEGTRTVRRCAWYDKEHPTFADALAWCRRESWIHAWNHPESTFFISRSPLDNDKLHTHLLHRMTQLLCYAN